MADQPLSVTVELHCLQGNDSIPLRRILLKEPYWYSRVGRGTKTNGHDLKPEENNAWFESKVMSRHHAALYADPEKKKLFIEDVGSTHGTYVRGLKLSPNHRELLFDEDLIVFGADVTHKSAHFPALKTRLAIKWSNEEVIDVETPSPAPQVRNCFSADFNSGDQPSDSDIDVIREVVRQTSIEIIPHPRTFSVPDSDISEAESSNDSSIKPAYHEESPTSSPPGIHYDGKEVDDTLDRDYDNVDDEDDVEEEEDEEEEEEEEEVSEDDLQLPGEEDVDHVDASNARESSLTDSNYEDSDVFDDEDVDHLDGTSTADIVTSSPISLRNQHIFQPTAVKDSPTSRSGIVFQNPRARTPSPSDAAMVKPKQDFAQSPQPRSCFAPIAPWMDHYAADLKGIQPDIREKDRHEDFTSWLFDTGPDARSGMFDEFGQAKPVQNRISNVSCHVAPDNFYDPFMQTWAGPSTAHGNPALENHAGPATAALGHRPSSPGSRKIAVSLNDILNQSEVQTTEARVPDQSVTLKRKAEHMDNVSETHPSQNQSVTQETSEHLPDAQLVDYVLVPESILPDQQQLNETLLDIVPEDPQPPRKKVKKEKQISHNEHRSKHSVAKYAAAAMAGAAIGAVGTIFGLAALPADFFI